MMTLNIISKLSKKTFAMIATVGFFLLTAVFAIPSIVDAAPGATPPGGNVAASFYSVAIDDGANDNLFLDSTGYISNPSGNVTVDDQLIVKATDMFPALLADARPSGLAAWFLGGWGIMVSSSDDGITAAFSNNNTYNDNDPDSETFVKLAYNDGGAAGQDVAASFTNHGAGGSIDTAVILGTESSALETSGPSVFGGNVSVFGNIYGSRFYDKDNATYYLDPGITSNLRDINARDIDARYATLSQVVDASNSSYNLALSGYSNLYGINALRANISLMYDKDDSDYYINPNSVSKVNQISGAVATFNQFTDANDSGTYVNPNGTSIMHDIRVDRVYDRTYLDYFLDPAGTSVFNSVKANSFYDKGDINYYLDPQYTSRLNNLNVYGGNSTSGTPKFSFANTGLDVNNTDVTVNSSTNRAAVVAKGANGSKQAALWADGGLQVDYNMTLSGFMYNLYGDLVLNDSVDVRGLLYNGGSSTLTVQDNLDVNGTLYSNSFYPSYMYTTGNVYTGHLYLGKGKNLYDYDNTGYYLDPHSGSRFWNLTVVSSFTNTSDSRIKKNQRPVSYGLSDILKLKPKMYDLYGSNFKNGELVLEDEHSPSMGLIAQEVYDVIPESVKKPDNESEELWGLEYKNFIPVIINAIQELKSEKDAEIVELKNEIEELKTVVCELKPESKVCN